MQGLRAGTFDLTVNYGKDTGGNTAGTRRRRRLSRRLGAARHVPGRLVCYLHGVCVRGQDRDSEDENQRTFTLRIDGKTAPIFSEA